MIILVLTRPEDETQPDIERMERKLGEKSKLFLSHVYDQDYDPEKKKPAVSRVKTDKAVVKERTERSSSINVDIDMEQEVRHGSVSRLTVDTLKSWCKSRGISVSNKKKAELVDMIIREFS